MRIMAAVVTRVAKPKERALASRIPTWRGAIRPASNIHKATVTATKTLSRMRERKMRVDAEISGGPGSSGGDGAAVMCHRLAGALRGRRGPRETAAPGR